MGCRGPLKGIPELSQDVLQLHDVISVRNGGKIIFATDDFFAVAENLIKAEEPIWNEGCYTEFGKWMDGWETRRKRKPGHDFCIIELAALAVIQGIELNTAFFTGNHSPSVSVQAAGDLDPSLQDLTRQSTLGSEATERDIQLADVSKSWTTILDRVTLKPGYPETCRNMFTISEGNQTWRYIRLNLYPDGGVARLRVYGRVAPSTQLSGQLVDLAGFINGGECVEFSNAHFGHPKNLISPTASLGMYDGWETARRLDRPPILQEVENGQLNHSGSEWCILKLGLPGKIATIIVDTKHFKGNYPDLVKIEATETVDEAKGNWQTILPFSKVTADKEHVFKVTMEKIFQLVKVTIQPDGGISRIRIMGFPT